VAHANALCNGYSLDTIGVGVNIAMAMECFEEGLLTTKDTDGIELRFGDADAMIAMVHKIAHREGIGAVLADGPLAAAKQIGGGAERLAMQVKNQAYPMHEPRLKRGLALSYAVSPTGPDHIHALQDSGLEVADADGFLISEPWYGDPLRKMGAFEPIALEDLGPRKARATAYSMMNYAANNCLLTCAFTYWLLDERVQLVRAATGWDVGAYELLKVGERALTLARVFNVREGLGAEDDRLADRSYEPTTGGALADGGIDQQELRRAVRMYYGIMGWDEETGVPLAGKLHELGISWAVDFLPRD
jgi:aldehyde:ferredoxin oxidoreductase